MAVSGETFHHTNLHRGNFSIAAPRMSGRMVSIGCRVGPGMAVGVGDTGGVGITVAAGRGIGVDVGLIVDIGDGAAVGMGVGDGNPFSGGHGVRAKIPHLTQSFFPFRRATTGHGYMEAIRRMRVTEKTCRFMVQEGWCRVL